MTLESTIRYLDRVRLSLLFLAAGAFLLAVAGGVSAVSANSPTPKLALFVQGAGPALIFSGLLVVARSIVTLAQVMAITAVERRQTGEGSSVNPR